MNNLMIGLLSEYKNKVIFFLAQADRHIVSHGSIVSQLHSNKAKLSKLKTTIASMPSFSDITCLLYQLNNLESSIIELNKKLDIVMLSAVGRLGLGLDDLRLANKKLSNLVAQEINLTSNDSVVLLLRECEQEIERVYHRLVCNCDVSVDILKVMGGARN